MLPLGVLGTGQLTAFRTGAHEVRYFSKNMAFFMDGS